MIHASIVVALLVTGPAFSAYAENHHGSLRKTKTDLKEISRLTEPAALGNFTNRELASQFPCSRTVHPFDIGWGTCGTYAPGQKNYYWCDKDKNPYGIYAFQACQECGYCYVNRLEVYLDYIHCHNEADGPGNAEEIYGRLEATMGGVTHVFWSKSSRSDVSINEGKSHYIRQFRYFDNVDDRDTITVGGHLKEDDFWSDDDLGYKVQYRTMNDIHSAPGGVLVVPVYWGYPSETYISASFQLKFV